MLSILFDDRGARPENWPTAIEICFAEGKPKAQKQNGARRPFSQVVVVVAVAILVVVVIVVVVEAHVIAKLGAQTVNLEE